MAEDSGSLQGLAPGQTTNVDINGPEYTSRGLRSKYEMSDRPNKRQLKKTPEDVFGVEKKIQK